MAAKKSKCGAAANRARGRGRGRGRGGMGPQAAREAPDFLNDEAWAGRLEAVLTQHPGQTREAAAAFLKDSWGLFVAETGIDQVADEEEPQEQEPPEEQPAPPPRRTLRNRRPVSPASPHHSPVRDEPLRSPSPTLPPSPMLGARPPLLFRAPDETTFGRLEIDEDEPFNLENSLSHVHPGVLRAARERKIFPMFHCTVRGLMAMKLQRSKALVQDTPHFQLRGGSLDLVQSSSAFKNAPEDDDLSYEELLSAQSTFLRVIFEAGWGDHIVALFDKLFGIVKEHRHCLRLSGQRALVKYFAQSRRTFHTAVLNKTKIPNIGKVDEVALSHIANDVVTDNYESDLVQRSSASHSVSFSSLSLPSGPGSSLLLLQPSLLACLPSSRPSPRLLAMP